MRRFVRRLVCVGCVGCRKLLESLCVGPASVLRRFAYIPYRDIYSPCGGGNIPREYTGQCAFRAESRKVERDGQTGRLVANNFFSSVVVAMIRFGKLSFAEAMPRAEYLNGIKTPRRAKCAGTARRDQRALRSLNDGDSQC